MMMMMMVITVVVVVSNLQLAFLHNITIVPRYTSLLPGYHSSLGQVPKNDLWVLLMKHVYIRVIYLLTYSLFISTFACR